MNQEELHEWVFTAVDEITRGSGPSYATLGGVLAKLVGKRQIREGEEGAVVQAIGTLMLEGKLTWKTQAVEPSLRLWVSR